ncbi:Transposon protein, putative, CACTA, En/Spm sub-class [Melia azedarach]|uniref:Transposon protein, putative, CACTA, En/Spm sub-class n=1 Tax=Melia azedarach TaxID=155640 RepID=A0ACC1XH46_MELAZ|nr:Transposon protein, putative, CACTA, En/Spm sub-class [Melia azedarach]
MDRSWMQLQDRLSQEYVDGINSFMKVAKKCADATNCIRCPCIRCLNVLIYPLDVVDHHLYQFGISPTYCTWVYHGENCQPNSRGGGKHFYSLIEPVNYLLPK